MSENSRQMTPDELEAHGYPRDFFDLTGEAREQAIEQQKAWEIRRGGTAGPIVQPGDVFDVHVPGDYAQRVRVVSERDAGERWATGLIPCRVLQHGADVATVSQDVTSPSAPLAGRILPYSIGVLTNPAWSTPVPAATLEEAPRG